MSDEQPNENNGEHTENGADTAPTETAAEPEQDAHGEPADTAGAEDTDWKAEADKWKSLARKHESRHLDALGLSPGELDQLRQQVKDRDELREQVESRESQLSTAQQNLAAEQLHTRLARSGLSSEDATAVIEHIDPSRLIEDGAPSTSAIESVAASLSRTVARGVDEDQGQSSPTPAVAADQWLRAKARK